MANPSLQIGNDNWAIKEDNLLGYSTAGTRFVPEPITMTRASAGTRVNPEGLVETVELLGSELVTNGDFATDTDWSKGTGWTISGGSANCDGSQSSQSNLYQTGIVPINISYKVTFTTTVSAGGVTLAIGGSNAQTITTESGTYTFISKATSGDSNFYFSANSDFIGSISNVSVKESTKNNLARVDYDGSVSSLLVEPERTNALQYSEPTSSETSASGITYESFSWAIGFDNCIKFGDNSVTRYRYFTGTILNSTQYVISAYVIMDDLSEPVLGTSPTGGDFLLRVGGQSATTGNLPNVNMGNNIYRVSSVITTISVASTTGILKYSSQSNKGFRVVGFQVEQGSYPTSYIPTDGSTVTRVKDQYSKTGISNLINSEEGVLFVEMAALSDDLTNRAVSLSDGTLNNGIQIEYFNVSNRIRFRVYAGGVLRATIQAIGITITNTNKLALKWESGFMTVYINGSILNTAQAIASVPTGLDTLKFDLGQGSSKLLGKVKQLQVFKTALSDSELATLTT